MNLSDFFIKIGVKDETSSKLKTITSGIGKGLATAAKIGTAAITASAVAVAKLTTSSIEAYSEFQQLVGGVETLFGNGGKSLDEYMRSVGSTSSETVKAYQSQKAAQEEVFANAENAYKNAGMSANEYMETVTSFSAALVSSLGGDTQAAAQTADVAITDMADNANKMGSDISSIQNAYQGFAKQNYTMLDNLKLGYGGTQSEMQRLIDDANALNKAQGITTDYQISSYADIVNAIHDVQTNMGITGTTANEASSTIQGSLSMVKSAWSNVLTAMGGGTDSFTMDFGTAVDNLMDSAVTLFDNVEPHVITAVQSIGSGIQKIAPKLAEMLPPMVESLIPSLVSALTDLVEGASGIIPTLVELIAECAPQIISAGLTILSALGSGIIDNIDTLVDAAIQIITDLVSYLTENVDALVDGAVQIISALAEGLITNLPALATAAGQLIIGLVGALIEHIPELLTAGVELVAGLLSGINSFIDSIAESGSQLIASLITGISSQLAPIVSAAGEIISNIISGINTGFDQMVSAGSYLVQGLWNGLNSSIDWLKSMITGWVGNVVSFLKNMFGISSPSKVTAEMGMYLVKGLAKGIVDNEELVDKAWNGISNSVTLDSSINSASGMASAASGTHGNVIYNNFYPQNLSEAQMNYIVSRINRQLGGVAI